MKILHITPFFSPNVGGVETHLDDLVSELDKNNIGSTVLTFQPLMSNIMAPYYEKRGNLIEIYRYWWFRNLFYTFEPYPVLDFLFLTPALFVRSLYFMLFNYKQYNVIHAHGFSAAFVGKILKKIFKTPLVVSTHATYELEKKPSLAQKIFYVLKDADKILTLSQKSKQELEYIGVNNNKISVYRYWVDQDIFKPMDISLSKKQIGIDSKKILVLFVGRMMPNKGVVEFLKASTLIKDNNIIFGLIGKGDLDGYVKGFADTNKQIVFFGRVDNKLLNYYYNSASVLVIPSTHNEGFGRVILEALSCGTPVVGSDLGAIPEAMDNTVGKIIKVTPQNIADAVEHILNFRHYNDLRVLCREYALERYSNKNIELFINTYKKLLT